jgi:hypothetical protein
MILTPVFILMLIMPALALIEVLHVKKFTILWIIITVFFGCLTYIFDLFFLDFIISYTFTFIASIIFYYAAIHQPVKKEIWNEIARELYDSEEYIERFKLDFERHTEMTLESFKDKAKCFTHEKVFEYKFNNFKLTIELGYYTLYKLKK